VLPLESALGLQHAHELYHKNAVTIQVLTATSVKVIQRRVVLLEYSDVSDGRAAFIIRAVANKATARNIPEGYHLQDNAFRAAERYRPRA
jgi:hypothetical protein